MANQEQVSASNALAREMGKDAAFRDKQVGHDRSHETLRSYARELMNRLLGGQAESTIAGATDAWMRGYEGFMQEIKH